MVQELSSHECVCHLQLVNLIRTLSVPKAHSQCANFNAISSRTHSPKESLYQLYQAIILNMHQFN